MQAKFRNVFSLPYNETVGNVFAFHTYYLCLDIYERSSTAP